ncbi:MAG: hypothetical protein EOO32_00230 [Comamonadaceae bacterium]|nr:MAG: hypothetical protein EOO32_00230 [Comamonadaceae bacterium]
MDLRHQFVFFSTDLLGISPSLDTISRIFTSDLVRKLGVIPSTYSEAVPTLNTSVNRLRLLLPDGSLDIYVGHSRIDIINQPINNQVSRPLSQFSAMVIDALKIVIDDSDVKANRLALITYFDDGVSAADASGLVMKNLMSPPEYFSDKPKADWTFRINGVTSLQIADQNEEVNSLLKVERNFALSSNGGGELFQQYSTFGEIDVNTANINVSSRFSVENCIEFIDKATALQASIKSSLAKKLEV